MKVVTGHWLPTTMKLGYIWCLYYPTIMLARVWHLPEATQLTQWAEMLFYHRGHGFCDGVTVLWSRS